MSSVCHIGSTVVVTYRADKRHWQYVVLHPQRKHWGAQYATHTKALTEGLRSGFQLTQHLSAFPHEHGETE